MGRFIDLTGQRFNRLTVLERVPWTQPNGKPATKWRCRCDCGALTEVFGCGLKSGHTGSFGCLNREIIRTHGQTKNRTYKSWDSMRQRCENTNAPDYPRYGGRGVTVCTRWGTYEAFFADMGERPPGTSLDRIDVDGDYTPSNCRWSSPTEQARNSTKAVLATIRGETRPLMEWIEFYGLPRRSYFRAHQRIAALGWDHERAIVTPNERTGEHD